MATVQVGTMLIENRPLILRTLGLESECYSGHWGVLVSVTSSTLDRKIRNAGWKFVFLSAEVKASAFGALAAGTILRALQQIFATAHKRDFNCLEVAKIAENRFLGMPYITVFARLRNIQQGYILGLMDESKTSQTPLE